MTTSDETDERAALRSVEEAETRARSHSFGDDPEGYEKVRPSYPEAVVDDLLERYGPCAVLDVGCGTGKAGRLFRSRGCTVLGVEADARMARIARSYDLDVEVVPFERWEPAGRRFDLVIAGQAWHWIDADDGTAQAAQALRSGGGLAPMWNYRRRPPDEIAETFAAVYEQHAPQLAPASVALGTMNSSAVLDRFAQALTTSGCFTDPELRRYPWHCSYTGAQWRALLASHSDHRLLEELPRERLLCAVEEAVEQLGGRIEVDYETVVASSVRLER